MREGSPFTSKRGNQKSILQRQIEYGRAGGSISGYGAARHASIGAQFGDKKYFPY
jgi:hypothetical protein